MMAYFTIWQNL